MSEPDAPPETITAITPVEHDPNSRRVYIGDRVVAELRTIDIETLGLAVGDSWTPDVTRAVAAAIDLAHARLEALAAIARRSRSCAELIERLERRGHTAEAARRATEELAEHGWLDDEGVARETITAVLRKGPAAAGYLRRRIEARGIDPAIAIRVVDDALGDTNPIDAALSVARKLHDAQEPPVPAAARRIAGKLARRGFDEDTVAIVLDRLGLARGRE